MADWRRNWGRSEHKYFPVHFVCILFSKEILLKEPSYLSHGACMSYSLSPLLDILVVTTLLTTWHAWYFASSKCHLLLAVAYARAAAVRCKRKYHKKCQTNNQEYSGKKCAWKADFIFLFKWQKKNSKSHHSNADGRTLLVIVWLPLYGCHCCTTTVNCQWMW